MCGWMGYKQMTRSRQICGLMGYKQTTRSRQVCDLMPCKQIRSSCIHSMMLRSQKQSWSIGDDSDGRAEPLLPPHQFSRHTSKDRAGHVDWYNLDLTRCYLWHVSPMRATISVLSRQSRSGMQEWTYFWGVRCVSPSPFGPWVTRVHLCPMIGQVSSRAMVLILLDCASWLVWKWRESFHRSYKSMKSLSRTARWVCTTLETRGLQWLSTLNSGKHLWLQYMGLKCLYFKQ